MNNDPLPKISTKMLNVSFGEKHVLKDININFPTEKITALIGPSGCGKSTLLRSFNRMHDLLPYANISGEVCLDGNNIYDDHLTVTQIRKKIGMVFQKPNPFPKTIYENIAYGLRIQGNNNPRELAEIVERSLRGAAIWDEVKDRLHTSALGLSGGQQQRLCIARVMAVAPEVILMDE